MFSQILILCLIVIIPILGWLVFAYGLYNPYYKKKKKDEKKPS